jgi:hypothetical protein
LRPTTQDLFSTRRCSGDVHSLPIACPAVSNLPLEGLSKSRSIFAWSLTLGALFEMKETPLLIGQALLFASSIACAADPTVPEPIKCYERAWDTRERGGLGLTAGQAVSLCSGTTDANMSLLCFVKAWGHPGDGGLGLTVGQAITLCKTNTLP